MQVAAPVATRGEAVRILLVDDDPRNLDALEAILQAPDLRLVRAGTAAAALGALLEGEFVAIVLDIELPDMNGLDLAQVIKQRKRTANVPIIFLTARYLEDSDRMHGYDVGAVDYLVKPVHADIFRSKVAVYVDLYRKTRELERASEYKTRFLATMSHELRTPLNSIIGFTGILMQQLAGPLNAEQAKQLAMVRSSARHLLALINDVLDLAKIEAGELRVSREHFDLRVAIAGAAGIIEPLAQKKGIALHVALPPALTVTGDRRRVEQVLLNLLNNAVKFTERGEVGLTVTPAGDVVHLRVTDTGIGIKAEDLRTLFQPFRQIDSTLTRQHEGTGLGLAISRRFADMMGGELRAESVWGTGSTFTFTLPLAAGAA